MVYYSTSILLKEYDKKGFYQNFFYMVIWYVYLLLWNWDVIYISKLYYLSLRLGGIHVISWRYQPVRGISRSRVKIDIEWSHKFRIMSWREQRYMGGQADYSGAIIYKHTMITNLHSIRAIGLKESYISLGPSHFLLGRNYLFHFSSTLESKLFVRSHWTLWDGQERDREETSTVLDV